MSLSSKRDKWISKREADGARNKKKNCKPAQYNDPVKDTFRAAGKGDRYREISGWYSEEVSERLRKIFGKKKTD